MTYNQRFGLTLILGAMYGRMIAPTDAWEIVSQIVICVGTMIFLASGDAKKDNKK